MGDPFTNRPQTRERRTVQSGSRHPASSHMAGAVAGEFIGRNYCISQGNFQCTQDCGDPDPEGEIGCEQICMAGVGADCRAEERGCRNQCYFLAAVQELLCYDQYCSGEGGSATASFDTLRFGIPVENSVCLKPLVRQQAGVGEQRRRDDEEV